MKNAVEITKELVRIESTNPGAGEDGVRNYIEKFLEESEVDTAWSETEQGRRNFIATIPSENASETDLPKLVLICHMDTVVIGEGWTKAPLEAMESGGRIYGRGACDMKSGLACALSVFKRTAEEVSAGKRKMIRPLRLICTVDEEGFMTGAEQVINDGFVRADDWVMDLEPTDGQIQMAHKGRLWLELNVHGITAHASRPEQGADAVAAAAEILCGIRKAFGTFPIHPEMGQTTVTFGQIKGGYQPYVVPDECKVWLDIRLAPPIDTEKALETVGEVILRVEREMSGIRADYQITGNRPYIEKNENSGLLGCLKEAVRSVCGCESQEGVFPGYTDTAVIAGKLGNRECLSYGPGSLAMAHKPDEYVEIEDIVRCERVLFDLIEHVSETDQ